MKDLIILTDNPIRNEICSTILINKFKNKLVLNNDSESLYIKKSSSGFELWFSPNDQLDNPKCMMGDTIEKCPNKKAYLTNLSYTSKAIASSIISTLKPLFGNMWVQSDEDDDWFGTADEFINDYCNR